MQQFFSLILILNVALPLFADEPAAKDSDIVVPREVTSLFNGKDLSAFYTWLVNHGREDPLNVFSVVDQVDGAPAIRISGEVLGGLYTKQKFASYKLVAEFRWGLATWGSRTNATKDSGILMHCTGRDGNYISKTFDGPWMRSYEFQIIQGGVGDLLVLPGYEPDGTILEYAATATVVKDRDGEPCWDAKGEAKVFRGGRVN